MKTLIIVRHAKSDWDSGAARDFDRPLNHRGRGDAPRIGAVLAQAGYLPDLVLCSPAVRTVQTWELLSQHFNLNSIEFKLIEDIYEASLSALLDVLEHHNNDENVVMLVGHNPGCTLLMEKLSRYYEEIKPGTAVILHSYSANWQDALHSRWMVHQCYRPREL